jgi:hypothetical protein
MVSIQPIEHNGRIVALAFRGRALISEQLAPEELALVQAKCLYALEIEAGALRGAYTEPAATQFAERTLAEVSACFDRGAYAIRLPSRPPRRVNH